MSKSNVPEHSPEAERNRVYVLISEIPQFFVTLALWVGYYVIIQFSIIALVVEAVVVWYRATQSLFGLLWSRGEQGIPQFETIGIMESYLSAVMLFVLAYGLYGLFVRSPERSRSGLPVLIDNVADLDRYLFGAIASVLIVAALRVVLSSADPQAQATRPFHWNIVVAVCALLVAISLYLAVDKLPKSG